MPVPCVFPGLPTAHPPCEVDRSMPPVVIELRNAEDWRDVVHQAVQSLAEGKLVAFPTETVYGVSASALDEEAVQRLVDVKGRQPGHALTLAIKSADEARDYAPEMSLLAQRLARRCWPGPVTLVVDDIHPDSLLHQLPAGVQHWVSPERTVGLRVPGHQVILDVLQMLCRPAGPEQRQSEGPARGRHCPRRGQCPGEPSRFGFGRRAVPLWRAVVGRPRRRESL